MHLKSLTLKGFKSFASATTLRLEPGITCVVGPNGSGKSNVVDAIAWVLGEQGAKTLRGGKMEDVIFAGTASRPPLGRAEVTLTIDNGDGALPIDYTEVSITRRMFRDGAGEYEINGSSCRLLDIQELLSDSGIGREMHVVVGQGQLEAILQSRPEDRRAFIEEAAGVLKHRKRREKALRRLDSTQANLTRLADLTGELRRQLKPLGRQAEIARRAQGVQAELRDARLRLAADDLMTLRAGFAGEQAGEHATRTRRAEVEASLIGARVEQETLESRLATAAPRLAAAQDTWYRLAALSERLGGTVRLAAERARHLTAPVEARAGERDPGELEAEADEVDRREAALAEEVARAQQALATTVAARERLESELKAAEQAQLTGLRAAADRRAAIATLTGRVEALGGSAASSAEEIQRLTDELAEAEQRTGQAERELHTARADVAELDGGGRSLDEWCSVAVDAHELARKRVAELVATERETEQQLAHWKARVEALSLGMSVRDGTAALLGAHGADQPAVGVLGRLAGLLRIEPWARAAIGAALGELSDAVAVADLDAAAQAMERLRAGSAGRASLLVGGSRPATAGRCGDPPAGAWWAAQLVRAPAELAAAVAAVLANVVVVDDLAAARAVVARDPELVAATRAGDLLGAHRGAGGLGGGQSAIEMQAALDEARTAVTTVERELASMWPALDGARAEEAARLSDVESAQEAAGAADAQRAAAAQRLGRLDQALRSARDEADRLRVRRDRAQAARVDALAALADGERRLAAARAEPEAAEPDSDLLDAAAVSVRQARAEELDARLAQRTAQERAGAIAGRADRLRRAAAAERAARARAEQARQARARGAAVAVAAHRAGERVLAMIAVSVTAAEAERDAATAARAEHASALDQVRARATELAAELERLTDAVHRAEVARTESRMKIEQLEERIVEAYGIGVDDLVAEYGPDIFVPAPLSRHGPSDPDAPPAPPVPFDRADQERRARAAEKDLALLGRVNPLALEEFAALEERYKFLSTQLEDVKATRRDLLTVVHEVDEKIRDVFAAAFADVAREFQVVFAALFPGGDGRLVLTDPDDPLTSGVEMEARPPGKKIKRLSLLSGGEKSLAAVAMLVAIFRARPSPFYVLDEVEAALDDVNLRRLIGLLTELRASSQLIVITHQKPTMEVADALYGVSMQRDGITTVISQRLRTPEPLPS